MTYMWQSKWTNRHRNNLQFWEKPKSAFNRFISIVTLVHALNDTAHKCRVVSSGVESSIY